MIDGPLNAQTSAESEKEMAQEELVNDTQVSVAESAEECLEILAEESLKALNSAASGSTDEDTLGGYPKSLPFRTFNILLIGHVDVGKSSFIRVMKNPEVVGRKIESRIRATTRVDLQQVVVKNTAEAQELLVFNFIDTPGIVMAQADVSGAAFMLDIIEGICSVFDQIHAICFVSPAGKTSLIDAVLFNKVIATLGPSFSSVAMLLLTNCEQFTPKKMAEFEADIVQHIQKTRDIVAYCNMGILRTGMLDDDNLDATDEKTCAAIRQMQLKRIQENRRQFVKRMVESPHQGLPSRLLLANLANLGLTRSDETDAPPDASLSRKADSKRKCNQERSRCAVEGETKSSGNYCILL